LAQAVDHAVVGDALDEAGEVAAKIAFAARLDKRCDKRLQRAFMTQIRACPSGVHHGFPGGLNGVRLESIRQRGEITLLERPCA